MSLGFWSVVLTTTGINAIVAIGVYITYLSGQASVGHAAIAAIAGYLSAVLTTNFGVPFPVAVLSGMAATALVGAVLSLVVIRMSVLIMALTTLAFGETMVVIVINTPYIGSAQGFRGIPLHTTIWLVFGLLAVLTVAVWRLDLSRLGLASRAIRDDRLTADSLGIDVRYLRLLTFALGAAVAGLGGALYAHFILVVTPLDAAFVKSFQFKIMVLLGGSEVFLGPVVGALLVTLLPELMRPLLAFGDSSVEAFRFIAYGVLIAAIIIVRPSGLMNRELISKMGSYGKKAFGLPGKSGADSKPKQAGADPPSTVEAGPPASMVFSAAPRESPRMATTSSPILIVAGVSKRYGGLQALDNVSFDVPTGLVTSIIGPNGAGKTTLFNCISGLTTLTAGSVTFQAREITGLAPHKVAFLGLTRTFQHTQPFRSLTILENVLTARYCRTSSGVTEAVFGLPRAGRERRESARIAREVLARVGLDRVDRYPHQLSYGNQKRLEIARALATEPTLLMLDEPSGGLAAHVIDELLELLGALRDDGLTLVVIEHNMSVVGSIADKLVVLDHGVKIADGDPDDVFATPVVIEAYVGQTHKA